MRKLINLLILLSIISFYRGNATVVKTKNDIGKPAPAIKGPVYNPLRPKPYTRMTVKV